MMLHLPALGIEGIMQITSR